MKIGIIGTGTIGTMFLKRFLEFTPSSDIYIINRTKQKSINLKNKYNVQIADSISDMTKICDYIFICVEPKNTGQVLDQIADPSKIYLTSVAMLKQDFYYSYIPDLKLVRLMPNILNEYGGPLIYSKGKNISNDEQIKTYLSKIGKIYEIEEKDMDQYMLLTSSFPAILANFLKLYAQELNIQFNNKIDDSIILDVFSSTLSVESILLKEQGFSIIEKVCTKGGITEQAISSMNNNKQFFAQMILKMKKRINKK